VICSSRLESRTTTVERDRPCPADLGKVDHGHLRQTLLQLVEAGVYEALAVLGGMVLGVFAQVTVSAGLQDFFGQLDVKLAFERGNFILKFFLISVIGRRTNPVTL